jgi:penicillin amidase
VALAACLLGVTLAGLGWFSIGTQAGPPASGAAAVPGLAERVRIERDHLGVPHIDAATPEDAWLALGFAHAQDRLWQMEVQRRAATGRLSELFGRSTLPADRLARTLDLAGAARHEARALAPGARAVLEAYCRGVNRWLELIADGEVARPFELRWLDVEPEPWGPTDVLAIVRLRAWQLSRSLGASLLLDRLVREVGGVPSKDFFPVRARDGGRDLLGELLEWGRAADALAAASGLRGPAGSLGFVVGSRRSASGLPLLASDPHVEFQLPAVFYQAHLRTRSFELGGATWPGVPVFWMGTNTWAAWGQVALHASVSDLFDETLHPSDPLRYEQGGRWQQMERRVEVIGVRGGPDEELEVRLTRNGPLLGALRSGDARAQSLALRWTGYAERSGIEALLAAQQASSWSRFRDALRELPAPPTTFLYADRGGTIGTQVAGRLPVRVIDTGLLPVTGGSQYYAWRGYIDFDDLPSASGTELSHLVVSTHPEHAKLERRVSWLWSSPGGAARLRAALNSGPPITLDDALRLQRERRSWRARESVRFLLDGSRPQSRAAARVRQALLDWDGSSDIDSEGAALYHVFRQRLALRILERHVASPYISDLVAVSDPVPGLVLARFLDRVGAQQTAALADSALEDTWAHMRAKVGSNPQKWTWGRTHQLRLRHAFEEMGGPLLALVGRRLSRGPFPAPGDPESVWTMHHAQLPTDQLGVGPVMPFALDLADPRHPQVGLAGGQSGHPGDPRYDDALADWLVGRPRPFWMHWQDVAYHHIGVWELRPTGG